MHHIVHSIYSMILKFPAKSLGVESGFKFFIYVSNSSSSSSDTHSLATSSGVSESKYFSSSSCDLNARHSYSGFKST